MKIINEGKPITSIFFEDNGPYHVGKYGALSITPYEENGEMFHVTWFEIYFKDGTTIKCNGKYVLSVIYSPLNLIKNAN